MFGLEGIGHLPVEWGVHNQGGSEQPPRIDAATARHSRDFVITNPLNSLIILLFIEPSAMVQVPSFDWVLSPAP